MAKNMNDPEIYQQMELSHKEGNISKAFNSEQPLDMFPDFLLNWYDRVKRELPWRQTNDPYKIWVSEVMLQQTQVKTVIPYYEKFIKQFPSLEALAKSTLDEVYALWQGLGYYSRARRLWEGANYIVEKHGGVIKEGYKSLFKIPGIGEYTAGAIASIAFNEAVPAIDGNVKRVLSRLLAWEEPIDTAKSIAKFKEFIGRYQPKERPGDFNQGLMELGATICSPKRPKCEECPVKPMCKGYQKGEVLSLPHKKRKASPKTVIRLIFILKADEAVYLQKRPAKGLLANLWELPGVDIDLNQLEIIRSPNDKNKRYKTLLTLYQKVIKERAYDSQVVVKLKDAAVSGPISYKFSHRQWQMYWILIHLDSLDAKRELIKENEGEYGKGFKTSWAYLFDLKQILPTAFKKVSEEIILNKS